MSKQQPSKPAGKAAKKENKDDHDLTSILDETQRSDLTLLVANASQSMRQLLVDNFDASAGLNSGLLNQGKGKSDEEKMMNADISAVTDVEAYDKERKLLQQYEKELKSKQMVELKKDSLKAYDDWREEVYRRVREVVNSKDVAKKQLQRESKSTSATPKAPQTGGKVAKGSPPYGSLKFRDLFPPTKTPLTKLEMEKRTLVLHSLLLLLLSLEHYNAPSRILLLNVTSSLKLPLKTFEQDEYTTAKGLLEAAKEMTADEETKKRIEANKDSRKRNVNIAMAAGAAIIGVTGGLAAPMVAAGVGSVMGGLGLGATAAAGYLGSVAGSTYLVGGLFGAYGGRMAGEMMDNYAREVEDFEFVPVHGGSKTSEDQAQGAEQASDHDHKLRVTICVTGWLTDKEEVVRPWKVIGKGAEVFALKWELEALLNLGHAMDGMMQSAAWGYAQKQIIAQTVFADLASALWPIGVVKAARVIDNPFSVAKNRADKAGEVMADALINKAQGERPVTLIGYSLGARVIYSCLMSLAKRKAFNLIESVVLMGAPTPSDANMWRQMRAVVSGRLVNVFSENDYVLGFMYRTSSIQYGIAGLQKIDGLAGVENLNVSEEVKGHTKYRYLVGSILKKLGFDDIDMTIVEEEREALKKVEAEEKKNSLQSQRNRLLRRESTGGKVDEAKEADEEASDIEKQVKAKTQKSLTAQIIEWWYTPRVPNAKNAEKVAGNLQKAAANPADAGAALSDTVNDVRASTESYAVWAASKLPSMPGMSGKATSTAANPTKAAGDATKTVTGATKDPTKAAKDTAASAQSYTSYAAGYLPSLPSMGGGKGKAATPAAGAGKAAGDASKKVTDAAKDPSKAVGDAGKTVTDAAKDPSKAAGDATKAATNATNKLPASAPDAKKTASDTAAATQSYVGYAASYLPSMPGRGKSSTAPKDDAGKKATDTAKGATDAATKQAPATGSKVTDAAKQAPVVHQAADKAPDVSKAAGDASTAATSAAKGASDTATSAAKGAQKQASSYASYLPSMPGFGRSSKPSTPQKLPTERTTSDAKKSIPKLERKDSGKPSTPKLDRTPSGIKSPPPKLDRLPSGANKSVPKLERLPSGIKSPPAISRTPSGIKSPPPKLNRLPSGMKSPPMGAVNSLNEGVTNSLKEGSNQANKAAGAASSAAKAGADGATKAASSVPGAKQAGDAAGKGGEAVMGGAKAGSDAVTGGAKAGSDAVAGGAKQGQQALGKAGETVSIYAKSIPGFGK